MKTLQAEPAASAPTLLLFAGADGAVERWLLIGEGGVTERGGAGEPMPAPPFDIVLAVPGEQVAVHWLELADGLAPAQAAAAARLMLADASADPMTDMHLALGRPERGLTPAALVPAAQMAGWMAGAGAQGLEPAVVLPTSLLIVPPEDGLAAHARGPVTDYRGPAAAFSIEPDLADALIGEAPVEPQADEAFEAGLGPILAAPPLNLRQGAFAALRQSRLEGRRLRRLGMLALALALLTLAVQVATILSYTFAADRLRAEADSLAAQSPGGPSGPGFAGAAAVLFDAVRATPNVELTRLEYRPDGSLSATVMLDAPATLALLRNRIEGSGLAVTAGETRTAGGRPTADLTVAA